MFAGVAWVRWSSNWSRLDDRPYRPGRGTAHRCRSRTCECVGLTSRHRGCDFPRVRGGPGRSVDEIRLVSTAYGLLTAAVFAPTNLANLSAAQPAARAAFTAGRSLDRCVLLRIQLSRRAAKNSPPSHRQTLRRRRLGHGGGRFLGWFQVRFGCSCCTSSGGLSTVPITGCGDCTPSELP